MEIIVTKLSAEELNPAAYACSCGSQTGGGGGGGGGHSGGTNMCGARPGSGEIQEQHVEPPLS